MARDPEEQIGPLTFREWVTLLTKLNTLWNGDDSQPFVRSIVEKLTIPYGFDW